MTLAARPATAGALATEFPFFATIATILISLVSLG